MPGESKTVSFFNGAQAQSNITDFQNLSFFNQDFLT